MSTMQTVSERIAYLILIITAWALISIQLVIPGTQWTIMWFGVGCCIAAASIPARSWWKRRQAEQRYAEWLKAQGREGEGEP